MSASSILPFASLRAQPWKNGLGVTRTLFSDESESGSWTWKISIASVSGTQRYSLYPGVHRILMALGPGDLTMTINGEDITLAPEQLTAFDGDDEVVGTARSEGFLDLNIMGLRSSWQPEVKVEANPSPTASPDNPTVLIALVDDCTIDGQRMSRLDSVRLTPGSQPTCKGKFVIARLIDQRIAR